MLLSTINKFTDQIALLRGLFCIFVCRVWHKTFFVVAWFICHVKGKLNCENIPYFHMGMVVI